MVVCRRIVHPAYVRILSYLSHFLCHMPTLERYNKSEELSMGSPIRWYELTPTQISQQDLWHCEVLSHCGYLHSLSISAQAPH